MSSVHVCDDAIKIADWLVVFDDLHTEYEELTFGWQQKYFSQV